METCLAFFISGFSAGISNVNFIHHNDKVLVLVVQDFTDGDKNIFETLTKIKIP